MQENGWEELGFICSTLGTLLLPYGVYATKHVGLGEAVLFLDFLIGGLAVLGLTAVTIGLSQYDKD